MKPRLQPRRCVSTAGAQYLVLEFMELGGRGTKAFIPWSDFVLEVCLVILARARDFQGLLSYSYDLSDTPKRGRLTSLIRNGSISPMSLSLRPSKCVSGLRYPLESGVGPTHVSLK